VSPAPFAGPVLAGRVVRLEPVTAEHVAGLAAAASEDRSTYNWTPVPEGVDQFRALVEQARAEQDAGRRLTFATMTVAGRVVGSTSFLDPQRWPGGGAHLDSIEIGATWIAASAQRTAVNTEAKLLMLTHAFDELGVHRVVLNTDARNDRSRAAIARLGATFEGVLHSFRYGVEGTPRDTATFAIPARAWPEVRAGLVARLEG
jgi:N-acetyltransferase